MHKALALSLSHANTCDPLLQAHPPWAQDNTKVTVSPYCFPPFVFRLAPTHLGWDTQRQFTCRSRDPPGSKRRQLGSLQQPLQPRTMLRFGSLEFMSLDGSYDMILLPPPRDNDNGAVSPPAGGGIDDVFPTWQKSNIQVCPVTFPADGGGGGAGMAKEEATPRRLSSESMTPAPQRGTRRALTSRLRRRRASFPHNTPTPSRRTTPARSRRTCWALASYLRQRCSPSLTRLRHHPSIKRYRPFPIPCLLDSAATHQATPLRWTLS
jgi:hypothetical protein